MTTLHKAIYALNTSIVTIRGDVAYNANEQEVSYDMAQAQAKLVELQAQETSEQQKKEDTKTSALAKLSALGLTVEEIKSITG
jgi:hypothetical protein